MHVKEGQRSLYGVVDPVVEEEDMEHVQYRATSANYSYIYSSLCDQACKGWLFC
jgi:hypothetical protein